MTGYRDRERLFANETANALDISSHLSDREMTAAEREVVEALGAEFSEQVGGVWLLASGRFTANNGNGMESLIKRKLHDVFGYPPPERPERPLHLLLDSPGGSLDSAYTTVLYLSAYTADLRVYVPDRAKSAATLVAVGADRLYLSAFGELGPLDTQIPDPRNPANTLSALDCYQSVDYVRDFGIKTISATLPKLVNSTERQIPISTLLDSATSFALGAIAPMLHSVTALDFGGWGRSLMIGEHYARKLLESKAEDVHRPGVEGIAWQLVYGYTHHLFPIDFHEAQRIGLGVELMDQQTYEGASKVVGACRGKSFAGFLSKDEAKLEKEAEARRAAEALPEAQQARADGAGTDRAQAEADRVREIDYEEK
ncbi:hypothetical protein [Streptomyces sp. ODS28]|uniref:SDH family Clp fold serine proteinase n=1 Tax=Streptomyces sp. ODS28 TaxID=3136688 RepID=UPI0031EB0BB2